MKCVSVLKFDSSPPFIASETVLFRPIHPINGLRCRCPLGFTGDYCETEVDLCYSGPCKNNGRCRSREGGYTCECLEDFTGRVRPVELDTALRCFLIMFSIGGLVGGLVVIQWFSREALPRQQPQTTWNEILLTDNVRLHSNYFESKQINVINDIAYFIKQPHCTDTKIIHFTSTPKVICDKKVQQNLTERSACSPDLVILTQGS